MSQSTTAPATYTLRTPGGLSVLVEGASDMRLGVILTQLNAQLAGESAIPDVAISLDNATATTRIDWSSLSGGTWRIRGPATGRDRVQYLSTLLRMRLLTLGQAPLHGAAAVRDDEAYVILGDAGSGKTKILLSLLEAGWTFAAGEWLVVKSGRFESADDRVDLRARHLDDLGRLHPRLDAGLKARRLVTRLPGTRRFDRFELSSAALGVVRAEQGIAHRISKILLSRSTKDMPRASLCGTDEVVDKIVASELVRYADFIALHDRDSAPGDAPVDFVRDLPVLLAERFRENVARVQLEAVEHPATMSLDDLARLIGARP